MTKKKTSTRRLKSEMKYLKEYDPSKSKNLKDKKLIKEALLYCIETGDKDAFRDVLMAHINSTNKTSLAKKAGLGRRTIYDLIDPNKDFNPEFSTISSLIKALAI